MFLKTKTVKTIHISCCGTRILKQVRDLDVPIRGSSYLHALGTGLSLVPAHWATDDQVRFSSLANVIYPFSSHLCPNVGDTLFLMSSSSSWTPLIWHVSKPLSHQDSLYLLQQNCFCNAVSRTKFKIPIAKWPAHWRLWSSVWDSHGEGHVDCSQNTPPPLSSLTLQWLSLPGKPTVPSHRFSCVT